MAEDPSTAWSRVYCLRPYHPWKAGGVPNPDFDADSDGRLLDLKDGDERGISSAAEDFMAGLERLSLPLGTIVAIVPGHDATPGNEARPLAHVARKLARSDNRYRVRINALIRIETIPRQASSGDRSLHRQLRSLRVSHGAGMRGATVLLLDDIVTTGSSIEASRILLTEAGARVAAVALGRTVRYFHHAQ